MFSSFWLKTTASIACISFRDKKRPQCKNAADAIEHDKNILPPTGHFDCDTLAKLKSVKGYSQIRLDMFQPDEEIGFNPLQPTLKTNFNYRYMDIDKK